MIEEHQLFVLFAMRILGFILFLFNTKLSLLEGRFKNRGVIFNETILVCNSVNFFFFKRNVQTSTSDEFYSKVTSVNFFFFFSSEVLFFSPAVCFYYSSLHFF